MAGSDIAADTVGGSAIVANANGVRAKIDARCSELGRDPKGVLLVPVSKTKPQEDIMELYDAGWRAGAADRIEIGARKADDRGADRSAESF